MSAAPLGLPLPKLDDRRWDDLVEEGRALISLFAPEWTDYNTSDPGITLVELLAWLAEQELFRIDRLSAPLLVKLLRLAGGTAAPPRPARTVVSVLPAPSLPTAVIEEETEFVGSAAEVGFVRFRAVVKTVLVPVTLTAFQIQNGGTYFDRLPWLQRKEAVPVFGDPLESTFALLLGFDAPLPHDKEIALYYFVTDPDESDTARARIQSEWGESDASCHHSVRLVWEARTASGLWVPLHVTDETRALTLNGRILLRGSNLMAPTSLGRVEAPLYYVRARIVSGRYDAAPTIENIVTNAVLVEQAVVPPSAKGAKQPPTEVGSSTTLFEPLPAGDGGPEQVRSVSAPQVAGGQIVVVTEETGDQKVRWTTWQSRADFDASRRTASDFVLDAKHGTLTFGNGERGRTLPQGAKLFASYRSTRAEQGNVPAGTVTELVVADPKIGSMFQPCRAWGGRAGETSDDVHARVLDTLTSVDRAVTARDCEQLAIRVPGGVVAVAKAFPEVHPDLPGVPCPGVMSLIILPFLPKETPTPTPGLCKLVSCYLNRLGVTGSRIEVAGPIYRKITVRATIRLTKGSTTAVVLPAIGDHLRAFFDPLKGGPEGKGWTIGRDVYHSEVLRVLGATAGVAGVPLLELSLDDGEAECANLCLGPRGLPMLDPVSLEVKIGTAVVRSRKVSR